MARGGYRPGAGRKPAPKTYLSDAPAEKKDAEPPEKPLLGFALNYDDPLVFLKAVMNDGETDARIRVDAAKAMMPFVHKRQNGLGKKEEAAAKSEKAANKYSEYALPLYRVK